MPFPPPAPPSSPPASPPPADEVDRIMMVMAGAFDPAFGEAWTRRQVEDALMTGHCHAYLADPPDAQASGPAMAAGFALTRDGFKETELLLFAVLPQYRRRGIGRSILDRLLLDAGSRGSQRLLLEMRRGNPALSLYESMGFVPIGERRDYYRRPDGNRIDAVTFALDLKKVIDCKN